VAKKALALQLAMARTAQQHNATLKDEKGQPEPGPWKLGAVSAIELSLKVLKGEGGGGAHSAGGGQEQITGYAEPQLQLSGPGGIVATTPANTIFEQGNSFHAVKDGIACSRTERPAPRTSLTRRPGSSCTKSCRKPIARSQKKMGRFAVKTRFFSELLPNFRAAVNRADENPLIGPKTSIDQCVPST
jgi:hypothetical protein